MISTEGTSQVGREKAPAAIGRKVDQTTTGGLLISGGWEADPIISIHCRVRGRPTGLMESDCSGRGNIRSEEIVTINELGEMPMNIARRKLLLHHIAGPLGVRGRNSDNPVIVEKLGSAPSSPRYVLMCMSSAFAKSGRERLCLQNHLVRRPSDVPCCFVEIAAQRSLSGLNNTISAGCLQKGMLPLSQHP